MKRVLIAGLLAVLAAVPAAAQEQKGQRIQCWSDAKGQRMCGDRMPPEYAAGTREVFQDGRVVKTVKGAKTPEELAREEKERQDAEAKAKQEAYDRALVETYRSTEDIIAMRDERIALIDSRIASYEKNSGDTDKGLTDLKARAEALQKDNKPVPERLAKQIRQFEKAQTENQQALERARAERLSVQQRFAYDQKRYNEMHGLPADYTPPPKKAKASPPLVPVPAKKG